MAQPYQIPMSRLSPKGSSSQHITLPPPAAFQSQALISSQQQYQKLYQESVRDPEGFWKKEAEAFVWNKKFSKVLNYSFGKNAQVHWFADGQTNLSVNCLDRHLPALKDKTAIVYVPNEGESVKITYAKLHREVCYCANMLRKLGLKKGDCVVIFMSMIPEAAVVMLACARLGLVHVVINPLSPAKSLTERILDCGASVIITGNQSVRGEQVVSLKDVADEAMDACSKKGHVVSRCVVFLTTDRECEMIEDRDIFWHDAIMAEPAICDPVWMDAEDPLFVLYPRAVNEEPVGVVHSTAGYMVYAATTFKYLFDIKNDDVCFGTADLSNITGHTYLVYAPLLSGSTSVIFEGALDYPLPDRLWAVVEAEQVTILHTDPMALGDLKKEGELWPQRHNLSSLRLLGTMGGPISPDVWLWYYNVIGKKQCPVIDSWCQSAAGGILIGAFPGATDLKPGSATVPFFGIVPRVLDRNGKKCAVNQEGFLVIEKPWPGMLRSLYGRPELFGEKYFSKFPNVYFTGDMAYQDEDGYFWIVPKEECRKSKVEGRRS